MHDELTNRRGLMRSVAMRVAARARQAATASSETREQLESFAAAELEPAATSTDPRVRTFLPAQLTERCASREELLELADEFGLRTWRDAVCGISRLSVRLALSFPGKRPSRHGNAEQFSPEQSKPSWRGAPLKLLLALDLAEAAASGGGADLSTSGALWVFFSTGDSPSGLALEHGGACQVLFTPEPVPVGQQRSDSPSVTASGELMLPRVWAESVEALGLSTEEQAAWERLRLRLAEMQGVRPFDAESSPRAIHRVLGWPDERGGWMPLACAMVDEGVDLAGRPPAAHPQAPEFVTRAGEWRLLLQLTTEPRLGWIWGGDDRLYIWIKRDDLVRGDFSRVRAIVP